MNNSSSTCCLDTAFHFSSSDQLFATCESEGDLKYVSLEWLKRMKRAAARTKDLADLEHLDELSKPTEH